MWVKLTKDTPATTNRSKIIQWSWLYTTRYLLMIYPCAKFGKPMSKQKKSWTQAGHKSAGRLMDRQKARQSDSYLPPELRSGGYNYKIWNCTIFALWISSGKSKCIHTKHSLLITNLHEEQAYKFVQFSDFTKNRHLWTPIIVNISVAPPLDPIPFDIWRIILKRSSRL